MLFYSAAFDVAVSTARTISAWLHAHRKRHDRRPWQRAATCWVQTIMLVRWLYDATSIATIAPRCTGIVSNRLPLYPRSTSSVICENLQIW